MTAKPATTTRVQACVNWLKSRIDRGVFAPGQRLPSIRALARERGVSAFTATEAYGRLVAAGDARAQRGSGFYVARRGAQVQSRAPRSGDVDLPWLLHHMLESGHARGPGLGTLPPAWLEEARLDSALRSLAREGRWHDSGRAWGFAPLRQLLQQRLAALEILVAPEQIVLTTGITHALDLAVRCLLRPGDVVLTLEPCWFGIHGVLAAHGIRGLGVPCGAHGPDFDALAMAIAQPRARLLVMSSAARNPTGQALDHATVARIASLARIHDVAIFEDDAYADLCASPVRRVSAEDGLERTIYAGSYSKTLAANLRVGFLACSVAIAQEIADAKIASGFTTPELNERLLHKMLASGRYDRHCARLRARLADCRSAMRAHLAAVGVAVMGDDGDIGDGPFLWADMGVDTRVLAAAVLERGLLLAPGALFTHSQAASTWTRINATTDPREIDIVLSCRADLMRA